MAVLVSVEVPGQTVEGYDGMLAGLEPVLKGAKGFISHLSWPVDGGWRVMEIWETQADANEFFAKAVHPNLPPGIKPKRTLQELHSLVTP